MNKKPFGILIAIDFNSHPWNKFLKDEVFLNNEFSVVKHNTIFFSDDLFSLDKNGFKWGFLDFLKGKRKPSFENTEDIKVVFIRSKAQDNKNYIIGLYAFPKLLTSYIKFPKPIDEELEVNIKSEPVNVCHLCNYIDIETLEGKVDFLSEKLKNKGLGSYNYLSSKDVSKILDIIRLSNISDKKFSTIMRKLIISIPSNRLC